ncbi:hypothetical protein FQN54_006500 [Arachnomyces sp. PD_36]|nr:hypothetical protein FQN54_006500 [Arachnomyces sp. PD_36]
MATRPPSRVIILTSIVAVFLFLIYIFRQQAPLSPEARAPGHLGGNGNGNGNGAIDSSILEGEGIMPKLGNETAKAELGRSTWKLLHTMMARYPEEPTDEEAETLRSFVYLLSRLYPCGECASHFQKLLKEYPPQVSTRSIAAGWACHIHNEVNKSLDKEIFDCNNIGDFYDCGCADDEEGEGKDKARSEDSDSLSNPVEIHDEPPTRGG